MTGLLRKYKLQKYYSIGNELDINTINEIDYLCSFKCIITGTTLFTFIDNTDIVVFDYADVSNELLIYYKLHELKTLSWYDIICILEEVYNFKLKHVDMGKILKYIIPNHGITAKYNDLPICNF